MPHVSKRKLKSDVLQEIHSSLLDVLSSMPEAKKRKVLLNELLTDTEKIMLAKRLAVIFLLSKKVPPFQIWKRLNVSPSTIARLELGLSGKYRSLADLAERSENKTRLEKIIESFLSISMPAKVGPRWTWLDKYADR